MPPESSRVGTSDEWLRRAKSNLALAEQPKPAEVIWEDLCFEAQQAAEKAIKAVLVQREIDFPKRHDIRLLLTLLAQAGDKVPDEVSDAIDLTTYATEARYPGEYEPVTEAAYRSAVATAEKVVDWAETRLRGTE